MMFLVAGDLDMNPQFVQFTSMEAVAICLFHWTTTLLGTINRYTEE